MVTLEWKAVIKEVGLAEEHHWFTKGEIVAHQGLDQRLYELKKKEAARQLDRFLLNHRDGDLQQVFAALDIDNSQRLDLDELAGAAKEP